MTKLQKAIIGATLVAAMGAGIYETRQASSARAEVEALRQQQALLAEQIRQLQRVRDAATNLVPGLREEVGRLNHSTTELLRLRTEVTQLRANAGSADAGSAGQSPQEIPEWQKAYLKASSALWNESKLLLMKQRLNLTPEQAAAAEDNFRRRLEDSGGENRHVYQAQLKALLTPEQARQYDELTAYRSRDRSRYAAVSDVARAVTFLALQFGLTAEQQDKAFAALTQLYEASKQYQSRQSADGVSKETDDGMPYNEILLKRNAALKDVFTPEQFAIYRRYTDRLVKAEHMRAEAEK